MSPPALYFCTKLGRKSSECHECLFVVEGIFNLFRMRCSPLALNLGLPNEPHYYTDRWKLANYSPPRLMASDHAMLANVRAGEHQKSPEILDFSAALITSDGEL